MDKLIDKLSPILWAKWEKKSNITIKGFWAEDGSSYLITCPAQLTDTIILMQNFLSEKFRKIESMKKEINNLKQWLQE